MLAHHNAEESKEAFKDVVDTNTEGKRWLGVLFTVGDDGTVVLRRTTWDFPVDKFPVCVNLLKKAAVQELGLDTSPLPIAEEFAKKVEEHDEDDDRDSD